MQKVKLLLNNASNLLVDSKTPRLDAEVLLAHILEISRAQLLTREQVSDSEYAQFMQLIERRKTGEPVAYLTGHKEFWSLDFQVTPAVLIPRPETEELVEYVLAHFSATQPLRVLDLGTGSGVIAIALAFERPQWKILATDCSVDAIEVARANGVRLNVKNVEYRVANWFEDFPLREFDLILSNPPYIDACDPCLQEDVRFEPVGALVSKDQGLADIRHLVEQGVRYLKPSGYLILEHGALQAEAVKMLLKNAGYQNIFTCQDLSCLNRITGGKFNLQNV